MVNVRCWLWGKGFCRQEATKTVRIGPHVYHYCPDHDPLAALCAADRRDVK